MTTYSIYDGDEPAKSVGTNVFVSRAAAHLRLAVWEQAGVVEPGRLRVRANPAQEATA